MKKRLYTPGPSPIPDRVNLRMAEPIIYHRSAEFGSVLAAASDLLKYLFQTRNDVLIFAASSTGAMEAAVANLLSEDDKVLVVLGGKFGERWAEICRAYRLQTEIIDIEWGHAVDPAEIEKRLKTNPDIKAIFATQSETSTGVLHDIQTIGQIVRETSALFVVDAVTSIGAQRFLPDEWGIDVAVTGSQKAIMLPPGLAFASVGQRAWTASEKSNLPKFYWSFAKVKNSLLKKETPFTPAISLIVGLHEALTMMKEEGIENIWTRHARHAEAARQGIKAIGLELFTKDYSNVLTVAKIPEGIDGKTFVRQIRSQYGAIVAGGQDKLSGKIFRISHMGYMDDFDVLTAISAVEMALRDIGWRFEFGSGVAAVQRVLMS